MKSPLVSVIIPAYKNAEFLSDAINSVLKQTYSHFELIIVNDASPDNTDEVVKTFYDPRIKYILHEKNKGLSAARNTGIRNSTGDYIALLDGDDYFHPDKLKAHVKFLKRHPDIDVTYNARFELNHSSDTIRELWRPPVTVDLSDLILGYPFAPSDMVIRRERIFKVGLFEESYTYYGEDMDINCKLALDGCKFASVDRALNYRRFHSRRIIQNLRAYQEDEFRPLYNTFASDRFPIELSSYKDIAFSNRYLGWAIFAFLQEDTDLGQEYCLEAVRLNPSLLEGRPNGLLNEIIRYCILDDNRDHGELLRLVLNQLPDQLSFNEMTQSWSISRGFILKGIRAIIWDRIEEGRAYITQAIDSLAGINKPLLTQTAFDLINYEREFGWDATRSVINNLAPSFEKIRNLTGIHWSEGFYLLSKAYKNFDEHEYSKVPSLIIKAIFRDNSILRNRGIIKLFILSVLKTLHKLLGGKK